ncbi:MAG: hypothetical protein SCH66_12765 [Methanolobus sp.]|nr:hypothetical protein [Methanolobus sp.]
MLGEMIGELDGKTIGSRVLPSRGHGPKIENTEQFQGKLLGIEVSDMTTYWTVVMEGGILYGEGRGVTMTKEGDTLTYTISGVGKFKDKGPAVSYRGALYYWTSSPKFSRLNGIATIYEYESDENGNSHAKLWEWK